MTSAKELELTIRTATLLKSISQLVGMSDPVVARMMLMEAHEQFSALAKFVESCQPQLNKA